MTDNPMHRCNAAPLGRPVAGFVVSGAEKDKSAESDLEHSAFRHLEVLIARFGLKRPR